MSHGWVVVPAVGLLHVALCVSARAGDAPAAPPPQAPVADGLPDGRLGVRTAPILLLSRPDVRADLELSPEVAGDAARTIAELHGRALATRGMKGAQAVEARKAIERDEEAWLKGKLTPSQFVRLVQIDLQWEGPSALLSRPIFAETLGLTDEQRAAIARAVDRRNAARARPSYTPADERTLATETLAVLTRPQQERWRTILGRPFTPRLAAGPGAAPARR